MAEAAQPTPLDPAELGFEAIVYEKAPPRATIRLNRPDVLNAFDFRMLRELARAFEDASWDDEIRVVVVTGAGRAFCVGADLKERAGFDLDDWYKNREYIRSMFAAIRQTPQPVIAAAFGFDRVALDAPRVLGIALLVAGAALTLKK